MSRARRSRAATRSTRSWRARSAGAPRRRSSEPSATARSAICSPTIRAGTRCAASSPRSPSLPLDENVTIVAEVLEVRVRDMRAAPRFDRRGQDLRRHRHPHPDVLQPEVARARPAPWAPRHLRRQGRRLQGCAAARAPRLRALRRIGAARRERRRRPAVGRGADSDLPGHVDARELADREVDRLPARRTRRGRRPDSRRWFEPHAACTGSARRSRRCTAPSASPTGRRRDAPCGSPRRSCCRRRCSSAGPSSVPTHAVARRPRPGGLLERFDAALPFSLTDDQLDVGAQISDDLEHPVPMNRLVQGEVGSGKTVVALRAMLAVADSGGQSALLAPTEVLAAQHLRSIARMLGPELVGRAHADAPHRAAGGGRAQEGAAPRRRRPVAHRRRHARAHRRPGLVRRSRTRRRRRAAPVRGRAARGAAR